MRYTGPKLGKFDIKKAVARATSLFLTGAITVGGIVYLTKPQEKQKNPGRSDYTVSESIREEENSGQEQSQKDTLQNFKEKLKRQIQFSDVSLGAKDDKYINSITLDGKTIIVTLIDQTSISGEIGNLSLEDINVQDLYIYDSRSLELLEEMTEKQSRRESYSNLIQEYQALLDATKIKLYCNRVTVYNEFKYSNIGRTQDDGTENFNVKLGKSYIDISNCKKIWLDRAIISQKIMNELNRSNNLKELILTNAKCPNNTLVVKNPNVTTIRVDNSTYSLTRLLYKFDFTKCENLKIVSIGNGTQIENLDGLKGLKRLEQLAFSEFYGTTPTSILEIAGFDKKANEIFYTQSVSDPRVALSNNNLIHDISAIKDSNIKVLNITSLYHITSEQLYEVVQTLPNLERIVGLEVNNAEMCSEELIKYCDEHKISHPFTKKSLEIKNEIRRVVSELVTDDMDDFEKIKVISRYILKLLEYDKDFYIKDQNDPELIRKEWGENLYYSLMKGEGICTGYSELAAVLFTEAGVKVFKQEQFAHAFTLVEVNGVYYQIDLTSLDSVLNKYGIDIDDYDFELNTPYYMMKVGDNEYTESGEINGYSYSEPYGATQQRENIEKKKAFKSKMEFILQILGALGIGVAASGLTIYIYKDELKKYIEAKRRIRARIQAKEEEIKRRKQENRNDETGR